jgi:vanillate O-demethylase ferredoxin subunit
MLHVSVRFDYYTCQSPKINHIFAAGVLKHDKGVAIDGSFQIKVNSNGEVLTVPADMSIVEVLREHGYYVDTSCEQGYCGTCLTPYLEGEPEHHDTVLDVSDRARYVMICCARSKSPVLVLEL